MPVKIIHAAISENGTIDGNPGDQTKLEVCSRNWWKNDWKQLLRPLDPKLALDIVIQAEAGASNDNIGYSQYSRQTAYDEYRKAGSIAKIKNPCNTDCSAFAALCCRAAGLPIDISKASPTTETLAEFLESTGLFITLTGEEYLTSDSFLLPGDILNTPGKHCCIVAEGGSAAYNKCVISDYLPRGYSEKYEGYFTTTGNVWMRKDAGTSFKEMCAIPPRTGQIYCSGGFSTSGKRDWLYVSIKQDAVLYTGFVSSLYLRKED